MVQDVISESLMINTFFSFLKMPVKMVSASYEPCVPPSLCYSGILGKVNKQQIVEFTQVYTVYSEVYSDLWSW